MFPITIYFDQVAEQPNIPAVVNKCLVYLKLDVCLILSKTVEFTEMIPGTFPILRNSL